MKPTEPEGVRAGPDGDVSVTVAVHDEGVLTVTGVLHVMLVEVVRVLTVMVAAVVDELSE